MSLLMRSLVRLNSPTFVALQQTHIVSVRKVKAAAATAAVRQSRYILYISGLCARYLTTACLKTRYQAVVISEDKIMVTH